MANKQVPLMSVIKKVKQMANHNSEAKQYAAKHNLDIVTISWEDNARFKNSIYGPCISDMTLQVNNNNMPVIRQSNYSDKTWDVQIDKIPIVVGNQLLSDDQKQCDNLQTISLSEYLVHFDEYITKQTENKKINLLRKNGKDTHVLMSSQCCFLPIQSSKQTKFNVSIFNYQSAINDPAVLVIIATAKGSSAQIIQGNQQKLFFNNHGKKADFIGQRLSDNRREKGLNIYGGMSAIEKQENCIVIIQIPLKQKFKFRQKECKPPLPPPQQPPFKMFYGGMEDEQLNYKSLKKRSLPVQNDEVNVESAIVNISETLYPICICGAELRKYQLQYAYMSSNNVNSGNITCDECGEKITDNTQIVWHCLKEKKVSVHRFGYDLCAKCGDKQLIYDELSGLNVIERDEKYPIRVTLQYYKSTDNGVISEKIMNDIKNLLNKSQKQADFIGSLVVATDENDEKRPTEPELTAFNVGYAKIFEALKKYGGKDWNKYYEKCLEEEVNDLDILNLTDDDLKELFPKMGPRVRIKKWIESRKQSEDTVNFMEGIL